MNNLGSYLSVKHAALSPATLRFTEEIYSKVSAFDRNSKASLIDKVSYLIRLFHLAKVQVKDIPISVLAKNPRPHRAGSYLTEDANSILKKFAQAHDLKLGVALDVIILEALKLSKEYSLDVVLVSKGC